MEEKSKSVEKTKSVKERIIEEHQKGMEPPLIAQLLSVSNSLVAKVLYLHKRSESAIIRPPEPTLNEEEFGLSAMERKDSDERMEEIEPKLNEEEFGLGITENTIPYMYDSEGNKTDLPKLNEEGEKK